MLMKEVKAFYIQFVRKIVQELNIHQIKVTLHHAIKEKKQKPLIYTMLENSTGTKYTPGLLHHDKKKVFRIPHGRK